METLILFGVVVLITHFLEGITGFGCTVIALPFAVLLVGVKTAVPVLTVLSLILSSYILFIDHKKIVWKAYLKVIALVGLGLPFGMMAYSYLPEDILKKVLGVFMILVAIRGLYNSVGIKEKTKNLGKMVLNTLLFLGGIIHGAFSTGGPFVVIYAAQTLKDKRNFRATLSAVWVTLNSIIALRIFINGGFTKEACTFLLGSLPFLIVGMILGNKAHNKVKDKTFKKIIYIVLFISGFFMF